MDLDLKTWVEVSSTKARRNYQTIRKLAGKSLVMAVVKSNAYGHGLVDFSLLMDKAGADWFGVDGITEALRLRREGIIKPILVLGYVTPNNFSIARVNDIRITVSSFESLRQLPKLNSSLPPLKVHLKINTGMNRQGIFVHEIPKAFSYLKRAPNVKLEGVFSHFAAAGENEMATKSQLNLFQKARMLINSHHGFRPLFHMAATSGLLAVPEAKFDMVRIGIGLYGFWPSEKLKESRSLKIKLEPILTWKTIISEIKTVPAGSGIGYSFTEVVKRESKIAVCPIGYWHGYPIQASQKGIVMVKGRPAKVLGRVSMDMIVIDVTNIKNAKVGDEAVLVGPKNPANRLAKLSNSIPYEIITGINPQIKREYI